MQTAVSGDLKTYKVDEAHSTVRFWVRHLMIAKVHGELSDVTGSVVLDSTNPASSRVEVEIKADSLSTKQEQRDAHLKSADFLDVEHFKTIDFKSTAVKSTGENEFEVVGDLTIHGVSQPVTLQVELTPEIASPFGGFKVGATATAKINREDFGITWNQALESGGVLVGKEINIEIDLELDRPE